MSLVGKEVRGSQTSRLPKKAVQIPEGVNITLNLKGKVEVSGPKGNLSLSLPLGIKVVKEKNEIFVERKNDSKKFKSLHGSIRSLINNMITGVTSGFTKELELVGVGYRASISENELVLTLGFSHPVKIKPPEGISLSVSSANKISIWGIDKELVGQVAAQIRKIKPPEVYKGKGIRYEGEKIRRKPGKAVKVAGGGR